MEETVRTLLQNQDSLEGPKVDPLDLMKAYKVQQAEKWKVTPAVSSQSGI